MDLEEKAICDFIDSHKKELISFTQQLVRINSVNGNETKVAKVIQKKLKQHGIKSRLVGEDKNRLNLVAEIGSGKKSFILNGHTDTVPFGDLKKWKYSPLSAKIVGNKLFGRGTNDMKSGDAAIVFAAIALKKNSKLNRKLKICFTIDEEDGKKDGLKFLLKKGLKADAALIPEAHFKKLRIGARGAIKVKLMTFGKTAHSGKNEGKNAVLDMAKLLIEVNKTKFKFKKTSFFPKPKITVGTMIHGGTAVNVCPDYCEAICDARLSLGQTEQSVLNDIKKVLNKAKKKGIKAKVLVEAILLPSNVKPNHKLVQLTHKSIKTVLRKKLPNFYSSSSFDGSVLTPNGIPCISFGQNGKNAHKENEFVFINSIPVVAKVLALTAKSFLE